MSKARGIFISYRRDTGSTMSRMIYDRLRFEKGYQCFLDVEKLHAGDFRQGIEKELAKCDIFILILSKNALNRCSNRSDNVRQEIETAKELGLTFIPVMSEDFVWPEVMPEGLEYIKNLNAIPYVQVYSESFFERLYAFIDSQRMDNVPEGGEDREEAAVSPAPQSAGVPGTAEREPVLQKDPQVPGPSGKRGKGVPLPLVAGGAALLVIIILILLLSGGGGRAAETTAAGTPAESTAAESGAETSAAESGEETSAAESGEETTAAADTGESAASKAEDTGSETGETEAGTQLPEGVDTDVVFDEDLIDGEDPWPFTEDVEAVG